MKNLLSVIALGLVSFTANADDNIAASYRVADIDIVTLNIQQLALLESDRESYQWSLELENTRRMEAVLASR